MPDLLSSAGGGATTGAALGSIIPGVGTAVGGIIGGVGGLVVSLFGNSAAKQAALERARRADLSNAATMGKAEAEAGTSGFDQNQGSMAAYLSMMSGEFRRQNDLAVKQANEGADLANLGSGFQAASGFGSTVFNVAKASNFWQGK